MRYIFKKNSKKYILSSIVALYRRKLNILEEKTIVDTNVHKDFFMKTMP